MPRVLIVSNRLPITIERSGAEFAMKPSSGGLATGLASVHGGEDSAWIGWPGPIGALTQDERRTVESRLAERRLVPVYLSEGDVESYYERFSNGLLWPLFHYMLGHVPLESEGWASYEAVNRRFAEVVAREWKPGDLVWVHDYQLMALPRLLRERLPDARIGFFLHIPFPASAVLRALPSRENVLRGLLGADLIGFHTPAYVRHFAAALLRILGIETTVDGIEHEGREIRLGSFPMGVDAQRWAALAHDPDVRARASERRAESNASILVGIDRLDYTKGIPRRLLAYERLLKEHTELLGKVRLIQVAVPSRASVGAYKTSRREVDALVGQIHGAFATPSWSPVHYLYRSISQRDVTALYLAADVMLVTPIRDGMNLVAKEFVASREDEDGVLVLSEFAGAASELADAVRVNPYDIAATAEAYHRALTMPSDERRARMRSMRQRVFEQDAPAWAKHFLDVLRSTGSTGSNGARSSGAKDTRSSGAHADARAVETAIQRARSASHLIVLADYDGTLVPFAKRPELAAPDAELIALLSELGSRGDVSLHLLSGRPRQDLETWFGGLPIGLHAEHGLWSRTAAGEPWRRLAVAALPYRDRFQAILEDFASRTPGARVEVKSEVLAWHWRDADVVFARQQANELRLYLAEIASNVGVEILSGDRLVEVRPHGLHKGAVLPAVIDRAPPNATILALGDDRTDEDLFACLPEDALMVHVGENPSLARVRVKSFVEARELLRAVRS